ncbi:copper amine oxidase [Paenibacillus thalictri]|uniref:Copper amine oxidase n=2 Tax=Paenibacillus thalictri TaxID=2527873 RepID=A0A4Q9DW10_9BACL|nr:copper amine oxidase [Paenibacillus thalictri]
MSAPQPLVMEATAPKQDERPSVLAWWEQQLTLALEMNRKDIAADYTYRKAAYDKSVGNNDEASQLYAQSESLWRESGSEAEPPWQADAPIAGGSAEIELYASGITPLASRPPAKFEPSSGVYLGILGADRRVAFDFSKVESVYGRKHAMYLAYVGWRKYQTDTDSYFPIRNAQRAKELGASLQIGWEPRYGLEDVQDDEYVRRFAREAKASGIPVFLRYASEMNGAWVPWHGDPQQYVEKFRLIHDIMKEEAPNVAMVWSPNFLPADSLDDYYPGDEYVDWVGFSLYATPYAMEKLDLTTNQIDYFRPLYDKYAHKPIMISEGAVSHYHLKTGTDFAKWGEGQIGNMYGFLPRMFPQIKAITYFNFSKQRAAQTGMEHVYDLGENPLMDHLYQRLIQSDYYLGTMDEGNRRPSSAEDSTYSKIGELPAGLPGKRKLFAYIKLQDGRQPVFVTYTQNDKMVASSYEIPWEIDIDLSGLDPKIPLKITAYSGKMEKMAESDIPFQSTMTRQ